MAAPRFAALLQRLERGVACEHESAADAHLGPADARRLAAACAAHASSPLTSLDVSTNSVGPAGGAALASALAACPRLASLSLSDNVLIGRYLSDKGQAYDGEGADCSAVHALLSPEATRCLSRLDLSHNHLGDEGASALSLALATLERPALELVLGFSKLTPKGVRLLCASLRRPVRPPGRKPALGALQLRNNTLLAAGAAAVAASLSPVDSAGEWTGTALAVSVLGLMNNHIEAEGARSIAGALRGAQRGRNPFISTLDVCSNCLGEAGVAALVELLRPVESFAGPPEGFADGGGDVEMEKERFQGAPLASLLLHRNNAGDVGVAALCDALAENECLQELRVSNNHVHAEGAAALAAALARPGCPLVAVDATRNHFSPAEEAALLAAMPTIKIGHGPI